jgi:hypothetical protein
VPISRKVLFFTIPEINEGYLSLLKFMFFLFVLRFFQLLVERGQIDSFGRVVPEEKIFLEINHSETRMACGSHVC